MAVMKSTNNLHIVNTAKVSVIIPAYNAEATIDQTLSSVFNQTYPSLEIIVVNDGSKDGTLRLLERYGDRINLISIPNQGVSIARNTGLKYATGEYVQFLDADDLLMPTKIEVQIKALQSEKADIAYGDWQRFTEANGEFTYKEIHNRQLSKNIEVDIFTDFWCPPAVLLYTKTIVDKIGNWKEWLPIIQDARYMLDAALNHGKFVYCPVLVAQYRTGQEQSLSSKNALNFVKDCYVNAMDVWELWKNDKIDQEIKKEAIIRCLRYCITEFSTQDKVLFHKAITSILQVSPNYVPSQSGILQSLSKYLGYRNAEKIAAAKRKIWR